jgi:hypothetical protein
MDNRMAAAQFVCTQYYNQNPRLLTYVLSKPPDRVKYSALKPLAPTLRNRGVGAKRRASCRGPRTLRTTWTIRSRPDDVAVIPQDVHAVMIRNGS